MSAFGSFRNPVCLVSVSVPIALAAHACLVEALTLRMDARRWGAVVATAALSMTRPLALDPIAMLSRAAVTELGERCASVVFCGDPAFGWFAGRLPDAQWGQPPPLSWG